MYFYDCKHGDIFTDENNNVYLAHNGSLLEYDPSSITCTLIRQVGPIVPKSSMKIIGKIEDMNKLYKDIIGLINLHGVSLD